MNVSGERILIFGDSLSHHGDDNAPEIWPVDQGSNRSASAPGDLLASLLLEQGAQAVMIDANVGRSAINFWSGGARHQFNTSDDLIAADQEFAPTKVIVFLGTNDLGMDTTSDATGFTMIKNAFPNAQVIAIGPPIFADDKLNSQAETVYGTLRDVFGSNNVIDARPLSSTDGRASDGIHFGASAAAEFAYQLVPAVKNTGGLPLWQMLGLGALGIGLFVVAGSWWHKREARSAQMQGQLGTGEPETEDEPEEPEDEHDEHDEREETEAERAAETRAAVHWYAKKYGITPLEARKLVTSDKAEDINHEIELWRANHGFPAPNSALVRGLVQEKIHGLGWGFASPKRDEEMAEKSLHEEEQAIEAYGERADEADDPELKHIFEHNRAEEETHAEHLRKWGQGQLGTEGNEPSQGFDEVMKKWKRAIAAYKKTIKQLAEGSNDSEPIYKARARLDKIMNEATAYLPGYSKHPIYDQLEAEKNAITATIDVADKQGEKVRYDDRQTEIKRLKEEERAARAHLPSDYRKLSGLEAPRKPKGQITVFDAYTVDLDQGGKLVRETIDTTTSGDYGADPLGPDEHGIFRWRMVPSGDVVDKAEYDRRLTRGKLKGGLEAPRAMKIAATDPATMTPAQINKELDKLDVEDSRLGDEMIAAGRGYERPSEYLKMDDPLSRQLRAISDRRMALRIEIEGRYGPGAPSRMPAGFKRRKQPGMEG